MKSNKFFSIKQSAQILGIQYLALVEMVKTRKIPSHKIRSRYFLSEIQINAMQGNAPIELNIDLDEPVDIKEASAYIGISWQTLRKESLDNKLTFSQVGTSRMYSKQDIINYLQKTQIQAF